MQSVEECGQRKGCVGELFHHILHLLKVLKGLGNPRALGIVEVEIGEQVNSGLQLLDVDSVCNWMDDIRVVRIRYQEVERIIPRGSFSLHKVGGGVRRCESQGVQT